MAAFIYTNSSYTTAEEIHSPFDYQAAWMHADWSPLAYTDWSLFTYTEGPQLANSDDWCDTDDDTNPAIAHTAYKSSLNVEFTNKTNESHSRTEADRVYEINNTPALTPCSSNSDADSSESFSREVEDPYIFNELPYNTATGDAFDEAMLDDIDVGSNLPDWTLNPHPNEFRSLTEAHLTLKTSLDGDNVADPALMLGDWLLDCTDQHLLWVLWEARTFAGIDIYPNIDGKRSRKRKRVVFVHKK